LPATRLAIEKIVHSPYDVVDFKAILTGDNGIRYGTSTPPVIVGPSENSVPFIRATDIKQGEILTANLLHTSAIQPSNMAKCVVEAGEMILVRSGVNTGDCAIVPEPLSNAYAAYDLILRFSNEVEPLFVSAFLDTTLGRKQLNVLKARSAQPHLNAEEVKSVRFIKPPLDVQRELVAEMQDARERRTRRLADAEQELAGIDAFLLDVLGLVFPPADTRTVYAVRLNDVCSTLHNGRCDADFYAPRYAQVERVLFECPYPKVALFTLSPDLAGGATPTRGDEELYTDTGIKFLRILNVKPNEIDLNDVKYITQDVHDQMLGRSQLRTNDVLMTITGRVGTAAVVPAEILPANINQHIVRIRLQTPECLPEYLAAYLNSSTGNLLTNRGVSGGTRIAVDYGVVRNLQIPIPPHDVQQRIVQELQERKEAAQALREAATRE
jgi:hypothetical protein